MRRIPSRLLVVAALASLFATWANAQSDDDYRIGPRDVVSVEVLEDSSLDIDRARVAEDGSIELLHVGAVKIAGLTEAQARLAVEESLGRYLQRATVVVNVVEFRSKPITILGAVEKPGPLDYSGRWTLVEAIMEAGGPTATAGNKVHIARRASNGLSDEISIDLRDLLQRADPSVNIPLLANDLVTVSTATDITVYCVGEFALAGAITFRSTERITLLAAIARAGGLTDRASNRVLVRRSEGGEEILVSWKKLLAGRAPDVPLFEGDFVIVKESFF